MAFVGKTHFPRAGGNQWTQSFYDDVRALGNVWYVNSTHASAVDDAQHGYSPEAPLATIAYAVATAAKADNHDVVLVGPGHAETITGAAGIAMSVAGVKVVGLGRSPREHIINYTTAAGASFDITAARCMVQNLCFTAGFDNITAMMNINKADVVIDGCEFVISDGTNGAALGILTAATATRLRVTNNRFTGPAVNAGTTCAGCIQHEAGVDYLIKGNYFAGKMTQAIKNVATVLRGLIDDNRFVIGTGTLAITMAAASTPFVTNNRINVPSGTTPITCAAGFMAGNTYSAAAGVTAGTASTF